MVSYKTPHTIPVSYTYKKIHIYIEYQLVSLYHTRGKQLTSPHILWGLGPMLAKKNRIWFYV